MWLSIFGRTLPCLLRQPFRPPRLERPPDRLEAGGIRERSLSSLLTQLLAGNRRAGCRMGGSGCWQALREESGWRFVMTSALAGLADRAMPRDSGEIGRAGAQNLASGTNLKNFLWLCSRAQAVLTVDGAASHLARAFGVQKRDLVRSDEPPETGTTPAWERRRPGASLRKIASAACEISPRRKSSKRFVDFCVPPIGEAA